MDLLLLIIYNILTVYMFILFVYILLSWTPLVRSKFYYYLRVIVEPYINIFRGKLVFSNMDFGPTVGILLLYFVTYYLQRFLIM